MMRFDWTVTIDGVDVSALVKAGGTIDYGTPAHLGGFTAPVAAFDMFTEEGNPQWPGSWPALDLGMPVLIHVTWDGTTQWRRFTGELSAIEHGAYQRSITATGTIAKLAHMWGGATTMFSPRPIEQDADRVTWLYPSFGFDPPLVVEASPARWLKEIPGPQEDQPVLDQILRIADDADGNFQQDRLGVVRYRTRNFTTPPTVLIPEFITERESLNLVYDLTDVVNDVTIVFGEVHPLSHQRETYSETRSLGMIGVRKEILNTDLIWYEDAVGKAVQYLDQHTPDWQLNDVTLLMNLCTGPVADDVLDLQIGWPVTIATLPPGAPMAEYDGQIIGTTEVMHQTDYRYILHLAPFVNAAEEPNQDPIYPDGVITGYDSTGTVDGVGTEVGKKWRWCKWTATGTGHSITNSHDDMVWAKVLAVAGGGGGGYAYANAAAAGGGGGAGGLIDLSILIGMGTQPVTIGAGGTPGTSGHDTYALGATLYGGGHGGNQNGDGIGDDGGSGGGSGFSRADGSAQPPGATPGGGVDGQGWPGAFGGGGARSPAYGQTGGAGLTSTIDNTSRVYAKGGDGAPGSVISGAANSGTGGSGYYMGVADAGAGGSGVFIVRYRIA